MAGPIRFGVTIPNVGQFGDAAVLVNLAVRAEAAGWDGWFVWDHLLYHQPGWPVVDPWVAVSAAAVQTRRVRLGVLVAALPRCRPWRLAKTAATIDQLSGGRLVFGAALGSIPAEYEDFGESGDPRTRADRLDESLTIVDQLWQGRSVRHHGTHYQVDTGTALPTPIQRPRIPIWVGGRWPAHRPFRRAALWDGVMPVHGDYPHGSTIPARVIGEIADYVLTHRTSAEPFDIITEGESSDDPTAAAEQVAPYQEIGLTWWVEKLGWWRGDLNAAIRRIEAGPPRLAR